MRDEKEIRELAETLEKTEERIKEAAKAAGVSIQKVPELYGPLSAIKGMKDAFNWVLNDADLYMAHTIKLLKDVQAMFEREEKGAPQ